MIKDMDAMRGKKCKEGEGDWRQMGGKNRLVRDVLSEGGVCDLAALESYSVFLRWGIRQHILKDSRYMAVIDWGGFSLANHAVKECNP